MVTENEKMIADISAAMERAKELDAANPFLKRWRRNRFFVRQLVLTEKPKGEMVFTDLIKPGLPTPMRLTGLGVMLFRLGEDGGTREMLPYSGGWAPSMGDMEMCVGLMPLWSKRVPMPLLHLPDDPQHPAFDGFIELNDFWQFIDYDKRRLSVRVSEDIEDEREKTFLEITVALTEYSDTEFGKDSP